MASRMLRVLVVASLSLALTTLATINGIVIPGVQAAGLLISTVFVGAWGMTRWRRSGPWARTALDSAFILWLVVIGISLLVHGDVARRSLIAVWYIGFYMVIWLILHDWLSNGWLRREALVLAMLIAGAVSVIFALVQLLIWLTDSAPAPLPRFPAVFGNPNFFGAFLIVAIPIAAAQAMTRSSKGARRLMWLFTVSLFLCLLATFSRGAWLGLAGGATVWLCLAAAAGSWRPLGLLSRAWASRRGRVAAAIGALVLVGGVALSGWLLAQSLLLPGRGVGLREELLQAAAIQFQESPIWGHGLFTYGRELARLNDVQPDKLHSHAHSLLPHIAAESGVLGLLALLWTGISLVRGVWANLYRTQGAERAFTLGAVAGSTALLIHLQTDMPVMSPAIALAGLLALVLATAQPAHLHIPMTIRLGPRASHLRTALVSAAALILIGVASWNARVYSQYVSLLERASSGADYAGAAREMEGVISQDPSLAWYPAQQGFLWGMAAAGGDPVALVEGIRAYSRFLLQEPYYAFAWVNRAALLRQAGDPSAALADAQQAVMLDPEIWQYQMVLADMARAAGDEMLAKAAEQVALALNADAALAAPLRQSHPLAADDERLINIPNAHFLSIAIPRMFLPQVNYPAIISDTSSQDG